MSDEDYIRFLQDCDQEARTWLARSVPVALLVAGVALILGLSWVFG